MASIADILQEKDFKKVIDTLCKDTIEDRQSEEYLKEYNNDRTRRIKSVGKRIDKTVSVFSDTQKDANGDSLKTGTKTVSVARLVYAFPKKIVRTAVAFLFGGKMTISADENDDAFAEFKKVWKSGLKMHSVLKKFARIVKIETKSAIIFYPVVSKSKVLGLTINTTARLRLKVLSLKDGEFFPHFDDYGDMDAFTHKYEAIAEDGKKREHVRIYTAQNTITAINMDGSYNITSTPNLFQKIPVVYAEQESPEWEDITTLMDEFEMRVSRLADTNDYFSEPILKMFGMAKGAPNKDEAGKMLSFEMNESFDGKPLHGDAQYLTWEHTPDSIKLELDTLWNGIFSMSSTPDLSFDNVKGLGSVSGIAMKLMFLDAMLKAQDNSEIFEPTVARCVSVVIAGIANITNIKYSRALLENEIEVSFGSVLPEDTKELVEILQMANGDKAINSQETTSALSPFTKDAKEEMTRLTAELKKDNEMAGQSLMSSVQ